MNDAYETTAAREKTPQGERIEAKTPERICPNCGAGLLDSRCKLVCPDRACGYFMSCSDFY